MNKVDILVIGAGVIGLSSAYHLKREHPEKKVVVIDKLGASGQGNTSKSAGGFRNMFTSRNNIRLAESTIKWFEYLNNEMNHNIGFTKSTYLYLYSEKKFNEIKPAIKIAEKKGVELQLYESSVLERMLPNLIFDFKNDEEAEMMALNAIIIGLQGLNCGIVDADALTKSYEIEFLKLNGEIQYNIEVNSLILEPTRPLNIKDEPYIWQDIQITGVNTNKGEIKAETTIIAMGVWSENLLNSIGFESLMRPKSRSIYVFKDPKIESFIKTKGFNEYNILPLTQIPDIKVYFKADPGEGSLWMGVTEDIGKEFKLYNEPEVKESLYAKNVYLALTKYLPCFEGVRPINMWTGQRAVNSLDKQPVVTPGPGFIYVGATSGNGILKSDALGRIVAACYSGKDYAILFDERVFKISDIGIKDRKVEKELF